MAEHRRRHTDEWSAHFTRRGHRAPRPLAAGLEGAVYHLGEGLVAKVWSGPPPTDLDLLRRVHADLSRHPLTFATPEILDTEIHDGVLVTYERELTGSPFRTEPASTSSERDLPAAETATATSPGSSATRSRPSRSTRPPTP
ncbi:hypothetical protein ACFV4N_10845 [Actinosynnema sp. NPDC059797]